MALSNSWQGFAPELRGCKQMYLAWTAMFLKIMNKVPILENQEIPHKISEF